LNPTGTVQDLANAPFILKTVNAAAPNAQALAALSSGVLKSATVTGVVSISAPLTSIDGLTTVADKMIYTTASNVYATTDLTPVARALLAQTTFAGMAVVLGALPLTGGTMSGAIDMGNQQITDMADPTSSQDAVTLSYLNTALGLKLSLSGGTMTGQINMGSHFITNLLDPVNPQDAATRNYVDSVATGFAIQPAVFAATTPSDVYTVIYNNGASGIGATLTNAGALVAFPIDSLTPGATNRVLIKDQAAALQNGIYTITNAGSGAVAWILTRATDYDQPSEIQPGDLVVVNNGTVNAGTSWIETASVSSIGVDAIDFSQFTFSATAVLLKVNNLSDVANLTTAFNNISPSTTKGDLIANNGTDDVRLAVGGSNGQILQVNSAAATGLSYSTATYPVTTTINQILYSSATNTITGISSLAGGVLVTDSSSVPQFLTNPTAVGRVLLSGNSAIPTWSTASFPATAGTTGNVLTSDGTNWGSAPPVVASLLTTKGDLFGFSTVEARFPVATGNGKILQVDSTATFGISYSTATYPVTAGTAGNFLKSDGTNWTSAAGTSGTVTSVATAGLASGGTITTTGTITVTAAVKSDQTTSTSTSVAVVPGVQQYHPSATKAWAQWAGASGTIASSYNVSSVTHNSTGNFTVNFTVSFADTNYCASGSHSASGGSTSSFAIGTTFNVGSAQCRTFANGAAVDATLTCATFSGNQ
jgi:hypothetical protein